MNSDQINEALQIALDLWLVCILIAVCYEDKKHALSFDAATS